jgi:TM2 domain-containing membrane protein YozV
MAPGTAPVPNPNAPMSDKSRMTAGLLGIFLGGFGVHNFYLGFTNKAILQIVVTVFTCGLGAIWGLVEGIMIITGNESFQYDSDGRRLTE